MINKKIEVRTLSLRLFWVSLFLFFLVACQSEEVSPTNSVAEAETAVSTTTPSSTNNTSVATEPDIMPTDTAVPATNTPMPTPTVAPLTLETLDGTVELQPLPPTSYNDLLDNNIATGEWTEVEGLILILQTLAGEVEATTLPAVIAASGTPTLRRATDVANDSNTKPADKAEIERLLNILTPSPEALEKYSIPASEAFAKPDGIFKTTLLQDNCTDLATQGFDSDDLAGVKCFIYEEVEAGGQTHRIYYPSTWKDDESKQESLDNARTALIDSVTTYKELATVKSISMVFSLVNGGDALAQQSYFDSDSACPVTLFAAAKGDGMDIFKQTIAHEIFHCVQDWNFTTSSYASNSWWLEGSAEYFSNVVYPTVNHEQRFWESFRRQSLNKSLMQMGYENFIFFQDLANRIGDPALIGLLKEMSATGNPAAHATYLANYPEMDGMFQDFVVTFLSSGVADTGGGVIKSSGMYVTSITTVEDIGSFEFKTTPFVAQRYAVKYVQQKRFFLTGTEDENGRYSTVLKALRDNKTAWSALPEEIRTGCDQDDIYALAMTSVKDNYTYIIEATNVEKAECDSCLLGSWDIEPVSFAAFISSFMAQTPDMPAGATLEVAGHDYLRFETDGQLTTMRDDFQFIIGIPNAPKLYTTINSYGNGMYTADGEVIVVTDLVDTVESVAITTADGQIVSSFTGSRNNVSFFGTTASVNTGTDINSGNGPEAVTGTYICTPETLEITIPEGTVLFLRVEEIPPTPVPTPSP